ncbi:MAG: 1-deoxy-D-xylulose-5-phosphate reductoisomerase [Candidatus Omnitrophota bacterium]
MKNIAVIGSTGSIGKNSLQVLKAFPRLFRLTALSANSDIDNLCRQIKEFHPLMVCLRDKKKAALLKAKKGIGALEIFWGEEGLLDMLGDKRIDKVVMAISGSGALFPLLRAIAAKKDIALANKEALVMAGSLIMAQATRAKVKIMPVDSEQSAIWQCLNGEDKDKIKRIYLTASGGPFLAKSRYDLKHVSKREVLSHPRWRMGRKITVDSATLMNKGLELLEAMHLFGVGPDKIEIIVHPEAIVHSMVEFIDGVVLAQLAVTDMRVPIQYALSHPLRLPGSIKNLDFYRLKSLNFQRPDFHRFPCLGLAYRAAEALGTMPCVLNAANEACVAEFLKERLDFSAIAKVISQVLNRHRNVPHPALGDILEADTWARRKSLEYIARLN